MDDPSRVFVEAPNPQRLAVMDILAEEKQTTFTETLRRAELTSGSKGVAGMWLRLHELDWG